MPFQAVVLTLLFLMVLSLHRVYLGQQNLIVTESKVYLEQLNLIITESQVYIEQKT